MRFPSRLACMCFAWISELKSMIQRIQGSPHEAARHCAIAASLLVSYPRVILTVCDRYL